MMPMYFHAMEFAYLTYSCANSPVFIPQDKFERPNVLITNDSQMKNRDKDFRGTDKFQYVISPLDYHSGSVDLSLGKKQYAEYIVYSDTQDRKNKKNIVLGDQRDEIIDDARFALFTKRIFGKLFLYAESYIYDYQQEKKVAGFTRILQNISHDSIRNYLTLIQLPKCNYNNGKYEERDLRIQFLLENTFIKENK